MKKIETRIVPQETPPKFYAQHLKPYEFLSNEATGKTVLEVGCGDGYGSFYLTKVAAKVIGVDYESDIILRAQKEYKADNLKFICMDAIELGFEDNSFDIICAFQVIEHIPEDKLLKFLAGIKRVLSDEGKFYLSTLNLEHAVKSLLTYKKNPAHCKEFDLRELRALLLKVFLSVDIYGVGLTLKHLVYQRIKRIGLFNFFPNGINPVDKFYNKVTTDDFIITKHNLKKVIDFICICKKNIL